MRLQDRTPLLLEKPIGEGRVMLFTSGFDNLTNDLPLRPVFVAFVERAVRYLSGGEVDSSSRRVDELLQLRTQREAAGVGVEVIDPSGQRGLTLQRLGFGADLSACRVRGSTRCGWPTAGTTWSPPIPTGASRT